MLSHPVGRMSRPRRSANCPGRGRHPGRGIDVAQRTCKVEGCISPAKGRGWCNRHYLRWWNYGDPEAPTLKCGTPMGSTPWNKGRTAVLTCATCRRQFTAPGRPDQRYCSGRCKGVARSGDRNHNWAGGISAQYELERHSWPARKWRRDVFARDNRTCQQCGAVGVPVHADHIKPWIAFPELRFDLTNGRTLCVPCHEATPTFGISARGYA